MSEKIIFPEDDEAATLVTSNFWQSRIGNYYRVSDESIARWDGATHLKCGCGNIMEKRWTKCDACREKIQAAKYAALEKVDWDGVTPLCLYRGDQYFYNEEEVQEYCDEHNIKINELQLVLCEKCKPPKINVDDIFEDFLPDGMDYSDIPREIWDAAEEFNRVLRDYTPAFWEAGNKAVGCIVGLDVVE